MNFLLLLSLLAAAVFAAPAPEPASDATSQGPEAMYFPHYIVPVKQAKPNTAFGTKYTGDISYTPGQANEVRLLVGFDVPHDVPGPYCAIRFTLPKKWTDPDGYPWVVTGSGKLDVWSLEKPIGKGTTWNNRPKKISAQPQFKITQPLKGGDAIVTGPAPDDPSILCVPGRMDFEVAIQRPKASSFHWYELDEPLSGITLNVYV